VDVTSARYVADVKVLRSLGLGLDEQAVAAVKQWKFKPAMKDGQPVAAQVQVYANFRML
jgi:periplasmic protein TonB